MGRKKKNQNDIEKILKNYECDGQYVFVGKDLRIEEEKKRA